MGRYRRVLIKTFSISDISFIKKLTVKVKEVLNMEVQYIGDLPLPYSAYNPLRRQFLAEKFLETLLLEKDFEEDIILGICDVDLFEPGLNFVFGMASPFYSVCIVSTKRLKNSFYNLPENDSLLFNRVLTESIHEIGHTLGLEHCSNFPCVMNFSNSIDETDKKGYLFCEDCLEKFQKIVCTIHHF
ncbi:archaemetzincin family Zn-dependent metalloprotease [Nitrosophilus labii]|uniref:archaemetzincin family Zn-dependent metalloprotease n=1 Tax=Nitrosophilus labii TaxID=2706014 RepID=UPI0016576276|nr:archaemetzincin family Zn-dependent metalloprotease [Nitrosophilus labii]